MAKKNKNLCKKCGGKFVANKYTPHQKYCSEKCRDEARKDYKKEYNRKWRDRNPGYFRNHFKKK